MKSQKWPNHKNKVPHSSFGQKSLCGKMQNPEVGQKIFPMNAKCVWLTVPSPSTIAKVSVISLQCH